MKNLSLIGVIERSYNKILSVCAHGKATVMAEIDRQIDFYVQEVGMLANGTVVQLIIPLNIGRREHLPINSVLNAFCHPFFYIISL